MWLGHSWTNVHSMFAEKSKTLFNHNEYCDSNIHEYLCPSKDCAVIKLGESQALKQLLTVFANWTP